MPEVVDRVRAELTARLEEIDGEAGPLRAKLAELEKERAEIKRVLGKIKKGKPAGKKARQAGSKKARQPERKPDGRRKSKPRPRPARDPNATSIVEFLRTSPGATEAQIRKRTKIADAALASALEHLYETGELRKIVRDGARAVRYEVSA